MLSDNILSTYTMCGICGFVNYKNDPLLKAMTSRLEHRGPDEDGFFISGACVSLGVRRLKIIDLATGSQPVANEDGTVTVVFNGEIYNFKELRAGLKASGHRFRTNSDTEVLVHLYEEYGSDFPARMRGMFAFALWDAKTDTLLLARDHFGIKPLFYAVVGGKFFFASEIKSLLLSPEIPAGLDLAALDAYFSYLYSPSPSTVYKNIKKLEPAHTLVFKAGRMTLGAYWRLPDFSQAAAKSEGEYLEGITDLLEKSVTEQLVSDMPLGLLLSGGMDSSTALYYMAKASTAPVKTFTVGYGPKDASFNETEKARLLADVFRAEHHETILEPDIRAVMEKLSLQFDEPFADASAIPTYLVTKEARKNVTVALTGIGGDEIFNGYPRHLGARLLPYYLKAPGFLREGLWAGAKYLPESMASKNLPGRFKRFLRGAGRDFKDGYESWISYFSGEEKAGLYAAGLMPVLSRSPRSLQGKLEDPDDIFAFEIRNYLQDDLLCLADRTSMANSLELRVPFLDVRLVEFMAGAPLALKTRGFKLKYLLKRAMAGKLPPEIISAGKMGFQVPLARWYNEEIKDFAREVLSSSALRKSGYLDPAYIALLLKTHESGRRNLSDQIYAAMMFELWLMNAAKKPAAAAVPEVSSSRRALTILVCSDIIPCDEEGGSARVAWELARQLLKKGHKTLVLTKGSGVKKDFEVIEGLEIYRYHANPFRARGAVRRILQTHKKIDVLELHHPYTAFWALRLLKGAPAVYNFHSPWAEEFLIRSGDLKLNAAGKALGGAVRKFMERGCLRASKAVLNASAFMAEKLRSDHSLDSRIIPLGVDTRKFAPAPDTAAVRKKLKIPQDRFVIFTVRNLVGRMGLENLVEAAAFVVKKEPKALFIIGGRGYLKEKLAGMIAEAGMSGQVRLEGYISEEELPLYYQCADLFVLPTRLLEGFGLVTLEALACGTPVLATPVAANIEVLGGFSKEFLLKSESPQAIAEGIAGFMSGYSGRKDELRSSCRAFIESRYCWEKYAAEVEKVLFEAIDGKDGSGDAVCPACGCADMKAAGPDMNRCGACGLALRGEQYAVSPIYAAEAQKDIYVYSKLALFGQWLDKMNARFPGRGRLLDIGSAYGTFMELAKADGWAVEGIETSPEMAAGASAKGLKIHAGPLERLRLDSAYEAITVFEVLDVMKDPGAALKEIYRILKPGGALFMREFNASFHMVFESPALGGAFAALNLKPAVLHDYNFTAKALRILLEKAGFKDIKITNSRPTSGDPYRIGGKLGDFLTGLAKVIYYWLAQIIYFASFSRVLAGSSLMIEARK